MNLENKQEEIDSFLARKFKNRKETTNMTWASQQGQPQESIQNANTDVIKGKNIMERFIHSKGKEKNLKMDALKANAGNTFKPQKARKMSYQWGKAKPLISNTVAPPLLDVNDTGQVVRGNSAWDSKPPDQINLLLESSNLCVETQQNEGPGKGPDGTGK